MYCNRLALNKLKILPQNQWCLFFYFLLLIDWSLPMHFELSNINEESFFLSLIICTKKFIENKSNNKKFPFAWSGRKLIFCFLTTSLQKTYYNILFLLLFFDNNVSFVYRVPNFLYFLIMNSTPHAIWRLCNHSHSGWVTGI